MTGGTMTGVTLDPGALTDLLLITGVKGAVLLTTVAVLTLALRRASAAGRHLLWLLGTVALLALPALEPVMPDWGVELPWDVDLPGGVEFAGGGPGASVSSDVSGATGAAVVGSRRDHVAGTASAKFPGGAEPVAAAAPGVEPAPAGAQAAELVPAAAAAGGTGPSPEAGAVPVSRRPRLLVPLVWAGGVLLLLVALLRSLVAVRALAREAHPFPEGRVTRMAGELASRLGLRAPVRILRGAPDAMPMSFGIVRPTVLLPEGSERWPGSRLAAVLLHELAHVRRRDSLTQALAEGVRALHWFNPLVWLAVRRLRVEREHACDDRVLAAGARPSRYAEDLLALVHGFGLPRTVGGAAVPMARRGDLRRRLRAVLEEGRPRALSPRGVCAAVAAVALVVGPLAALTPSAVVTPSAAVTDDEEVRTTRPGPVRIGSTTPPAEPLTRSGTGTEVARVPDPAAPPGARPAQEATCGMAPRGWESTSHQSDDERHRLEWRRDGCEVEVRIEGRVEFTADFRDVESLGPGALLRIEEDDGGVERRVEVRPGSGGEPEYAYRVDGRDRPFDAGARAWFEGMLLQVFRRGGFMAGERVQALLDQGGVQAVVEELELLDSDHVFARYTEELLARADLGDDRVVGLLERARERVDSDHYLSGILEAAVLGRPLTDRLLDATLEVSRELASDHYRAGVLAGVLERSDLDAGRVRDLLGSASEIESDHYLSEILVGVAGRYVLQPEVRADYLAAARSLESDHYRAAVLTGLMDRSELADAELAEVLRAAGSIESDHYVTEILRQVPMEDLESGPLRDAYFEVAGVVGSDHYRSEALMPLVRSGDLSGELLSRVIDSAARMESDHYKAAVLVEIARGRRLEGPLREAYVRALESIGSSHYRGRVSEALVRAGG